jgi:anti-sigma regulatory factor (Ser/Thr protein kinase)
VLTVVLPRLLDGPNLCRFTESFIEACDGNLPDRVCLDFAELNFIEPTGVTFLSNFVHWLASMNVNADFQNHQRNSVSLRFLDDSLFFEQHLGQKNNPDARPRVTTKPLQRVGHAQSHDWVRSQLVPWLVARTGENAPTFASIGVCVSEVFNNIADHAGVDNGSIFLQHFPNINRITISVADFGLGIPHQVRTVTPDLNDVQCIIRSVKEGFTSKTTPRNRGSGLDYLLRTIVQANSGWVRIYSLGAYVTFVRGIYGVPIATSGSAAGFCPGTTIEINLRTDKLIHAEDEPEDLEW